MIDKNGIRKQIPVAGLACLMLEPGARISHMAVHLAATVGLTRPATAGQIACKIRAALRDDQASQLLAGLDEACRGAQTT